MRDEKLHDLNDLLWRSDQISNREGVVMATLGGAVMCRVVMCSVESNVRKCTGRNGVCGTHVTPL